MTEGDALDVMRSAVATSLLMAAPAIVSAMFIGLIIALLQALTQIQEMTLTFIPKIVGIMIALYISGPYMGATLNKVSLELFQTIETGFDRHTR